MEAALDNGCKLMNEGLYSKAVAQIMNVSTHQRLPLPAS